MKKIYQINKIPSFKFEIDIPTGISSFINYKGKADIYLFGKWVGWDNIFYKEEKNYLDSINNFFRFINYQENYTQDELKRLDHLNKSNIARKMFEQLSGWDFRFNDCQPNTDTFILRRKEQTYNAFFELIPEYIYKPRTFERYISRYKYEYFCNSGFGPANERKFLTAIEGSDLIKLLRLSFLSLIINYEKEHAYDIRCMNGHYSYKENLIEFCKKNNLV